MIKNRKIKLFFILPLMLYTIALYFFYIKYVPLVKHFQLLIFPFLLIVLVLTSLKIEWGTLFFVFFFPLINALPYYFGLFENIPYAPTALVLFLFYFLGWLIHYCLGGAKLSFKHPIFKPMILFSCAILISGLITALRYANFFPFLSDSVYELRTNINGVTAGGALMSTLFHSLNYLSGFAFFTILLATVKSKDHIKKLSIALMMSLPIGLIFGYYQRFKDISFGNTPFWIRMEQINSTFKDPNSFGVFLAAVVPLVLAMILVSKKELKIYFFGVFLLILFLFPYIGTRSPLLGLIVSLLFFLIFLIRVVLAAKKTSVRFFKRSVIFGTVLLIIIVIVVGFLTTNNARLFKRLNVSLGVLSSKEGWISISPERYFLWKEAVHMTKDYPFSGVGMGAYIIELPNYYKQDKETYEFGLESFRRIDSAENYFLHVSAELGLGGLFLVLWIFWMIFRQMNKAFKNCFRDDKNKYILIGVMAGLISLFVNLLFHSYIGSYEIKYTFWFLAALVFCMSKNEDESEKKFHINKRTKIFAFSLLILFFSAHLWNSTHSLSLKSRTEQLGLKQDFGLYQLEKTKDDREFRWTRGYGGVTIKIEKSVIEIPLLASHPDIMKHPVKVKIFLIKDFFKQKKLLDEITLNHSVWKTYEYSIPEEVNQEAILLLKISRTWNPLKTLGTPDPRNLGVAIGKIQFKDNL